MQVRIRVEMNLESYTAINVHDTKELYKLIRLV